MKGYNLSDTMSVGHALFWDKTTWFTKLYKVFPKR